jgi:hypothetical protein
MVIFHSYVSLPEGISIVLKMEVSINGDTLIAGCFMDHGSYENDEN